MNKILEEYIKWKEDHDDDYIVDEIFDFLHDFDRGEIVDLLEWVHYLWLHKIKDKIEQRLNSEK